MLLASNFGATQTTSKTRFDINCSGGSYFAIKPEVEEHSSAAYLEELEDISTIEDSIIVDFFDQLKTPPTAESKDSPFFKQPLPRRAMNYHQQASESLMSASADVYMDLSHFSETEKNVERRAINDGTLLTPLVDGNVDSNLNPFMAANNFQQPPNTQAPPATTYECGPPNEICFSVPQTTVSKISGFDHQVTYSNNNIGFSQQQHQQQTYSMAPSTSNAIYAELKPRSPPPVTTDSDIPTVINDHMYSSPSASRGYSAPSPAPSTASSITSCSTNDNLLDSSRASSSSGVRRKNTDTPKKSRMTKKQKYDEMVREQKRLEDQNEHFKKTLSHLERETKHYRDVLFNILKKK